MARVGRQRRHPSLRLGRTLGQRPGGRRHRRDLHLRPRRLRRRHHRRRDDPGLPARPRPAPTSCVRRPRPDAQGDLRRQPCRPPIKDINDSITDTLSSFSSRGVHGSIGVVKPDVAAPGDTIASAGMGTGDRPAGRSRAPRWPRRSPRASARWCAPGTRLHAADAQGRDDEHRRPRRVDRARTGPVTSTARPGSAPAGWTRSARSDPVLAYSPGADNPVSASFGVVRSRSTRAPSPRRSR